jgi:hypothetical protein
MLIRVCHGALIRVPSPSESESSASAMASFPRPRARGRLRVTSAANLILHDLLVSVLGPVSLLSAGGITSIFAAGPPAIFDVSHPTKASAGQDDTAT